MTMDVKFTLPLRNSELTKIGKPQSNLKHIKAIDKSPVLINSNNEIT